MKTVFVDIDTQIDFLYPAGALYVAGAEEIVPAIAALNRYAAARGIPVISTADAHAEDDPEFREWPPHCVVGTVGQQKPQATLLERRAVLPSSPAKWNAGGAEQWVLEKQALDCFTNANLRPLLEGLRAERYLVYGVVTEVCVQYAAFGLLATGKRVEIATDAVRHLDPARRDAMLAGFTARGGILTTASAAQAA